MSVKDNGQDRGYYQFAKEALAGWEASVAHKKKLYRVLWALIAICLAQCVMIWWLLLVRS